MARALNATIAERSHEYKRPECRTPTLLKPPHRKSPISIRHQGLVKNTHVEGLLHHLCSTCHRSWTDCRLIVCQSRDWLENVMEAKIVRTLAWRIWQIKGIDLQHTVVIYGVATISRLHKMTGLFRKIALQKRLYSAKETCNFIGLAKTKK